MLFLYAHYFSLMETLYFMFTKDAFFNKIYDELTAIYTYRRAWLILANQDITLKYRRSSLGPLWITLSMMISIYSMAFLYAKLFKTAIAIYLPFLASGLIGWAFLSTLILESSNAFIDSERYIKNQENFMSIFMMRLIVRNIIIFFHNLLAFVPIIFICHVPIGYHTLFLLPGLLIVTLNILFWGSLFATFGTRYRDFSQILASIIQVVFFLTPIMWRPESLSLSHQWIFLYNPFNQFLNLLRAPLLNESISYYTCLVVSIFSIIGFLLYALFMGKYKSRIVFWL